mmetsp:Transcript_9865/g.19713  ORF Transcript_9865/g.19713 Transcript_9865/m.19713 type:complete len:292 (+) Transcript_9865:1203-2078(+)
MPSVHDLPEDVPQILPRDLGVRLEVVERHRRAADEVAGVERVLAIPPLGPELLALEDDGMEEGDHEHDRPQLSRLRALEKLVAERRHGLEEVRLQAVGRLVGQLDAHLQNINGQRCRLRGEKEAEIVVCNGEIITPLLEPRARPLGREMDVLQKAPATVLVRGLDDLLSDRLLPLPQRHEPKVPRLVRDPILFADLLRVLDRVDARGEDEEDGRLGRAVGEGALEVERQRRHVLLAHLLLDKRRQRLAHAVRAQAPHDEQLRKFGELLPVSRQPLLLRPLLLVPVPEPLLR